MDPQKLLNSPPKKVRVVAKVSRITGLADSATELKNKTKKLRKLFETNSYQKRTQLSVLRRYKRRLDSINKENERRLEQSRRSGRKKLAPKIRPFIGSLFTATNDPLKVISQLAAFKTASRLARNDILGAVGPGLTLAAIIFGPRLLKMAAGSLLKGGLGSVGVGKGYEDILKKLSKKSNLTRGEEIALKNFDRYRKAGLSAEEAAYRSLTRGSGYSVDTAKEFRRLLRSETGVEARVAERAAARGVEGAGEGAAKGLFRGKVGKIGFGLLDVALAGYDFWGRKQEGQTNVQAGLGAIGGAAGAYLGFEGGVALGAAIGAAFGGVGAIPGAIIGGTLGFAGGWLGGMAGGGLMDFLTGVGGKSSGEMGSFGKSLERYERVVDKFSSYAAGISPGLVTDPSAVGGTPVPGEIQQVGQYQTNTFPGQHYGASREGGSRKHAGVDLQMTPNSKQVTFLGGKIIHVDNNPNPEGYGRYVDILTPSGYIERLAELATLSPGIRVGATVAPGQVISVGRGFSGVTHLEYRRPGTSGFTGTVNPIEFLKSQGVMSGSGRLNYRAGSGQSIPAPTPPPTAVQRNQPRIESYSDSESPFRRRQDIIPVPISGDSRQTLPSESRGTTINIGVSEQDLLNSFYKRVLLNTLQ